MQGARTSPPFRSVSGRTGSTTGRSTAFSARAPSGPSCGSSAERASPRTACSGRARARPSAGTDGEGRSARRDLAIGTRGWDVAALQFALAWHGFPSAVFDGVLGAHTDTALRKFQRWAGLDAGRNRRPVDVRGAPAPGAALADQAPGSGGRAYGDLYGPRGNRFHAGIDIPAPRARPSAQPLPGESSSRSR